MNLAGRTRPQQIAVMSTDAPKPQKRCCVVSVVASLTLLWIWPSRLVFWGSSGGGWYPSDCFMRSKNPAISLVVRHCHKTGLHALNGSQLIVCRPRLVTVRSMQAQTRVPVQRALNGASPGHWCLS